MADDTDPGPHLKTATVPQLIEELDRRSYEHLLIIVYADEDNAKQQRYRDSFKSSPWGGLGLAEHLKGVARREYTKRIGTVL